MRTDRSFSNGPPSSGEPSEQSCGRRRKVSDTSTATGCGNDGEILEFEVGGPPTIVLTAADGITGVRGPSAIAIGPAGEVYICDSDSSRILRYDVDYSNMTIVADATESAAPPRASPSIRVMTTPVTGSRARNFSAVCTAS